LSLNISRQNIKNLIWNFEAIHSSIMHANFQASSFCGVGGKCGDRLTHKRRQTFHYKKFINSSLASLEMDNLPAFSIYLHWLLFLDSDLVNWEWHVSPQQKMSLYIECETRVLAITFLKKLHDLNQKLSLSCQRRRKLPGEWQCLNSPSKTWNKNQDYVSFVLYE